MSDRHHSSPTNCRGFACCLLALMLGGCSDSNGISTSDDGASTSGGSGSATAGCADSGGRWVAAWEAVPTDAETPGDASLTPFAAGPSQTFRAVFTPLGSGGVARLHLSNRFGTLPVTFSTVSMARRTQGAAVDAGTSVPVTFGCQPGVTIAAGQDVLSDPVAFTIAPFQVLAVSVFAADSGAIPTHHFTARQTSYATVPGAGNHTGDADAGAFTQSTTVRPYVTGLDVLSTSDSSVLTFGDSITDGFQGPVSLVPQNTATIDLDERYPDDLERRIDAAGLPYAVANAGISGNRVLQDGQIPPFGPKAVERVDLDVISQAGVGTVIWLEGANDIGQDTLQMLTAEQLEAGYTQVIARMHAAGLRVLQGTMTPFGSNAMYGTARNNALRDTVNAWIKTQSPADAVIDFDAAVRDAANPEAIAASYDGGDGLHFSAAGYQRMAEAVDLGQLRAAP